MTEQLHRLEPGLRYRLPPNPTEDWPEGSGGEVFTVMSCGTIVRFDQEGLGWDESRYPGRPDGGQRYWYVRIDLEQKLRGVVVLQQVKIIGNELHLEEP
jgi:hypothetical protein